MLKTLLVPLVQYAAGAGGQLLGGLCDINAQVRERGHAVAGGRADVHIGCPEQRSGAAGQRHAYDFATPNQ
jgi:hypothetical protein